MFNIFVKVFFWAITFGLGSFLFKLGIAFFVFCWFRFANRSILSFDSESYFWAFLLI